MDDYVTENDMNVDDEVHNLAVFSSSEDPISYEEAVKHNEWRKAMDLEIIAIGKNETWELMTSLPIGAKKIGSGSTKSNTMRMENWKSTRLGLWQKGILSNLELIIMRPLLPWLDGLQS